MTPLLSRTHVLDQPMYQPEALRVFPEPQNAPWRARLRLRLTKGSAAPAVCIQGGGARGAWEAGVLAGLLKAGPNTCPSSIWGTSAGALNALWTRDPEVLSDPIKLLHRWTTLAHRLILSVVGGLVGFLALVCLFRLLPTSLSISFFVLATLLIAVLYKLAVQQKIVRLPGLIPPAFARLIIPKPRSIVPGCVVYTCVSNVDLKTRPEIWDPSQGGWFILDRKSSDCYAEVLDSGEIVDAFQVAVASASLPFIVRPTRLAGMTLLDGGLVANLPAGFVLSNGSLGGAYVLCIVPRRTEEPLSAHPIDSRTVRFLTDLRNEQATHRKAASGASSWSGPAHTHIPVFVLSPQRSLKSELLRFWPPLLRREFKQGYEEAKIFSESLDAFTSGDERPISKYLLEKVLEQSNVPVEQPNKPWWYMWVNTRW